MNDFDKKMNALRRQYAAEQDQITKDAHRAIGHINTAISQSSFPEVREALRAERKRIFEAMRNSHKYNRRCYTQQLELLQNQYSLHLEKNPSKTKLRRMMARLCRSAEADGQKSITLAFGNNRHVSITFD